MDLFLLIIVAILFIGLVVYLYRYNSSSYKGKAGEALVHNILMELPDEYYVMDDVVMNTVRGTTQIDHIVISKYGVFVIETKNYSGSIFGNDENKKWTQRIVTDVTYGKKWWKTYTYVTKNQFYNPVKQCLSHMYEIKNSLKEWPYLKIVPIVVFAGTAEISNVESNNHVVYDRDLLATIKSYDKIYLSKTDIQRIIEILTQLNVREFVDDKTHKRNIHKAKKEMIEKVSSGICPVCGGTLVERTGNYGSFWGCSNYPKCKYTTH